MFTSRRRAPGGGENPPKLAGTGTLLPDAIPPATVQAGGRTKRQPEAPFTGAGSLTPLGRWLIQAMFILFVALGVLSLFDSRWLSGWVAWGALELVFLSCSFTGRRRLMETASRCVRSLCDLDATTSIVIGTAVAMLLTIDGIRAGTSRWSSPVVSALAALLIMTLVAAVAAEHTAAGRD